jgi:hypothetical protein
MLVRLGNLSRRQLLDKVELAFHSLIGSQIEGCFVVLTDKKIRITRQPWTGNFERRAAVLNSAKPYDLKQLQKLL